MPHRSRGSSCRKPATAPSGAPTGRIRTSRKCRTTVISSTSSPTWRRPKPSAVPFSSTTRSASMGSRLKGKVAIVTGAGSVGPGWGNGRSTVVRFVQEGAKVFAVDCDAAGLKETVEKAPGIATHICDVTDGKAVAGMIKACVEKFGRVDVLVNNVGGSAAGGPVEMNEEVWDDQVDLNLKSGVIGCQHDLPA